MCFYLNNGLASLARATGNFLFAHSLIQAAVIYALPASSLEQGLLALEMGRLALTEQQITDSIPHMLTAVKHFQTGKLVIEESQTRLYLAAAMYHAGDESGARFHLQQAFEIAQNAKAHSLCLTSSSGYLVPMLEHFKLDHRLGRSAAKFYERLRQFEKSLPEIRRKLRKYAVEILPVKPKVVIWAFGGVKLTINGKEFNSLDWKSPTQREIIFYLLHHPEGASKARLLDLFWGNDKSGPNQLANLLYKMRRFLGEELVEYSAERYFFNHDLDYEYDVELFLHYREQVRHENNPFIRTGLHLRMLQIYRGVFLPESEGLWVIPEQERLRRMYLEAALALGEYYLEQREYPACLDVCWEVIEHEAQSEEIYRLAMRAAGAMGDRGSVNHYYQLYRRISHKTDSYDPSSETNQLYRQLMH